MNVKAKFMLLLAAAAVLRVACALWLTIVMADTKPPVRLNVENAVPRQVDESVQQAIVRDYSGAWQSLAAALTTNNDTTLKEDFVGFALDQLTQRVKDQQRSGLTTRVIDRGHQVEVIFYSLDGSAIELRDTATLETQILEGETVVVSERAQLRYYAIMTGAEDRWKVRVLESAKGD